VRGNRPINADEPATNGASAAPETAAAEPKSSRKRRRLRPPPLTPTLLAATVLVAIGFIVIAVLAGRGGSDSGGESAAPTPAPAGPEAPASASQTAEELGYPAFATSNTTRIGGGDPATIAAAVALAVFPSTSEATRPPAIALVGEDDWAGAVAAAVLMSAPVRAPILVSNEDDLPEATEEALAAAEPESAADVFAIGDVASPVAAPTTVDAASPAAEAAEIAALRDRRFRSPPDHVVVAPSDRPQFAMPAAAWAARSGDPVLYAGTKVLPGPTATALRRHTKVPVYVLGPPSAISAEVLREIEEIGPPVKRVSGKDPVANAIAFARYADEGFGWDINDPGHGFVIARDSTPLEAAAAAPLSASGTWGPLLLSDDAGRLPSAVRSYFLDVKPGYTTDPTRAFYNHVWVIGDQEAIDVNQQAEVNQLAELTRISGQR